MKQAVCVVRHEGDNAVSGGGGTVMLSLASTILSISLLSLQREDRFLSSGSIVVCYL